MISELNKRMNGFSKVLDLFNFLNPDELIKVSTEKYRKCGEKDRISCVTI